MPRTERHPLVLRQSGQESLLCAACSLRFYPSCFEKTRWVLNCPGNQLPVGWRRSQAFSAGRRDRSVMWHSHVQDKPAMPNSSNTRDVRCVMGRMFGAALHPTPPFSPTHVIIWRSGGLHWGFVNHVSVDLLSYTRSSATHSHRQRGGGDEQGRRNGT